mgnify:CR=1 FL=1
MQIGDRLALLFFLVVDRLHARYQRTNLPSSHKHACDVANELASRLRENSSPSAKARASETSHLLAAASLLMLAALLALLHLEIQQLDLLVLELRIEARGCVMEQLVCRSCEEISRTINKRWRISISAAAADAAASGASGVGVLAAAAAASVRAWRSFSISRTPRW